ncbi:MAG: 30S ribosomal protein S18 [bacterium]|nr:30S ribosomal protein S18 [bacterium]
MRPQKRKNRKKRDPLDISIDDIDYKNVAVLRKVVSNYSKILPAKRTGASSKMQRKFAKEIKRARTMGLLPFIPFIKK